ncbi:MAG: hypothetical protein ACFFBP_04200 [Promethearchaeota archaeon]
MKANKIEEIKFDNITITRRILKKIEPYVSKILFFITFIVFSIENLVGFLNFSWFFSPTGGSLLDGLVFIYFIIFLFFFFSVPFYFYSTMKGKIPSSKARSFEMLSSLVLFIGSSVNKFLSGINLCIDFLNTCFPVTMIVGFIILLFIVYLTWIIEFQFSYLKIKKYSKLTRIKKYSKFTGQDFKRIETFLNEEKLKINHKIIENLSFIIKETDEIVKSFKWDYEKFTFKRLEKYSDLIEQLLSCNEILSGFYYNSIAIFYRAKGLIKDGEFEEGITLLRTIIRDLSSESEKERYDLAKEQHKLAVYLANIKQYKEAYGIFINILKNLPLKKVQIIINFEVLGEVLENQGHLKARIAAKEKNYELLYNDLGLELYHELKTRSVRIKNIVSSIAVSGFCFLLIIYIILYLLGLVPLIS